MIHKMAGRHSLRKRSGPAESIKNNSVIYQIALHVWRYQ